MRTEEERKEKLNELKVGDRVFVKVCRPSAEKMFEAIVIKRGRKYLSLANEQRKWDIQQYDIESGIEKNTINYKNKIYLEYQDILDEQQHEKLSLFITRIISSYSCRDLPYSLETLQNIADLLKLEDKIK